MQQEDFLIRSQDEQDVDINNLEEIIVLRGVMHHMPVILDLMQALITPYHINIQAHHHRIIIDSIVSVVMQYYVLQTHSLYPIEQHDHFLAKDDKIIIDTALYSMQ